MKATKFYDQLLMPLWIEIESKRCQSFDIISSCKSSVHSSCCYRIVISSWLTDCCLSSDSLLQSYSKLYADVAIELQLPLMTFHSTNPNLVKLEQTSDYSAHSSVVIWCSCPAVKLSFYHLMKATVRAVERLDQSPPMAS